MKLKVLCCLVLLAVVGSAQQTVIANVSGESGGPALVHRFYYDASNNLKYDCVAKEKGNNTSVKRSDTTLTNIVVSTNVGTVTTASAHGLYPGARVTITGATVDTDLNAVYTVVTVPSSTTYTIATAAVADATYNEATLVISTRWPLETINSWLIKVNVYNGSNFLVGAFLADDTTHDPYSYSLACSNRATY